MRTSRTATLVLCCVGALTASGCSDRTPTGTDYTMTVDRRLEAYIRAPLAQTHAAAIEAVRQDMKYRLVYQTLDAREGVLEARTAAGEDVKVQTFKSTEGTTRALVGVGPLGDEPAMRALLTAIDKRARAIEPGAPPAPAATPAPAPGTGSGTGSGSAPVPAGAKQPG